MTSSELTKKQRKEIQRIAADWSKGKLTAKDLYDTVKKIEGINWSEQKDAINEELDRAVSSSSKSQFAGYKIIGVVGAVVVVVTLLALYVAVRANLKVEGLEDKVNPLMTIEGRINHLAAKVDELANAVATQATVLPSPIPSVLPTPTPLPPEPTETPTQTPTPTLTTEPRPIPLPTLVISGVVTTTEQVDLSKVELTLSSKGEGKQDWVSEKATRPDGSGAFHLSQAVEEPRYYRLEINAPLGTYVEGIVPSAGDWKVLTDAISGLITGLESQRTLITGTFSDVWVTLAAVPMIPSSEIRGEYVERSYRHPDPYSDNEQRGKGTVSTPVTVLGQWADNKQWRLCCCQTITGTGATYTHTFDEYFWERTEGEWGVTVASEQEAQLPAIYLPSGVNLSNPPSGWESKTIDGLSILSSQNVTATQSVTLEWRINNVQDWFRLEAWVPRGSQTAAYQIFAVVDGNEIRLTPLDGTPQVEPVPDSTMSAFKSIGTYRLNEECPIVIRLQAGEGVKAGFIRLLQKG